MKYLTLTCSLLLLGWLSSCSHKTEDDVPNTTTSSTTSGNTTSVTSTGKLMMHLHNYIDISEVDGYNIAYTTTTDNRKISLSMAQFYLSDIQLVKLDGSMLPLTGVKILKVEESEVYFLANAPVGNYKSIRFKVGLPPATNTSAPSGSPDSVILNHPEMWFGSSAQPDGYVFMNVQGKIDTTADASGTTNNMQPFTFKIGTDTHYQQVIMPDKNIVVTPDQYTYVHVLADYNKLFSGIAINQPAQLNVSTPADNNTAAGNKVAQNIPLIFSYEE